MTKGRNIKNFVKSQPFLCTPAVSLDVSDDLQAEISRFGCRSFRCFCLFSQNLAPLRSVFISYPLVIVLHLESIENNLFELGI